MRFINTSLLSLLFGVVFSAAALAANVDQEAVDQEIIVDTEVDEEFEDDAELYDAELIYASDLSGELKQAACKGKPLVLMFGSSECPYCSVVRSLYMEPLPADKRYRDIVVRELEIDSDSPVKDFSGKLTTMRELADSYGVYLVPTVIVFGPGGKQAGKEIVGISNEDFYGFYLDDALEVGISAVKQLPPEAC